MAAIVFGALGWTAPAQAQFSGSVTLTSNEIFRGESLSRDDPAVTIALGFDGPAGTFAGASASVAAGGHEPRIVAATQFAGIAARRGGLSVETGVIHRTYHRMVDTAYRRDYFELYAGVTSRTLKLRFHVSPDYSRDGRTSYYIDGNARLATLGQWTLDAHAGLSLVPADADSTHHGLRAYRDWRVQTSRPLGRLFVSAGVAGTNYPVFQTGNRARVFGSVSLPF